MPTLPELLKTTVELDGSDLHLSINSPPQVRVHGELRRLLPFFGLYSFVFAAFALADGLALAMFVKHAGSQALPRTYAIVAVANLIVIGLYIAVAERIRAGRVFRMILTGNIVAFGAAWIALRLLVIATSTFPAKSKYASEESRGECSVPTTASTLTK